MLSSFYFSVSVTKETLAGYREKGQGREEEGERDRHERGKELRPGRGDRREEEKKSRGGWLNVNGKRLVGTAEGGYHLTRKAPTLY